MPLKTPRRTWYQRSKEARQKKKKNVINLAASKGLAIYCESPCFASTLITVTTSVFIAVARSRHSRSKQDKHHRLWWSVSWNLCERTVKGAARFAWDCLLTAGHLCGDEGVKHSPLSSSLSWVNTSLRLQQRQARGNEKKKKTPKPITNDKICLLPSKRQWTTGNHE